MRKNNQTFYMYMYMYRSRPMVRSYLSQFLIFGVVGWFYEYLIFGKLPPYGYLLPFLPLYGFAGMILLWIDRLSLTSLTKIISATLLVILLECLSGLVSLKWYGFETWQYNQMTLCHNYISIPSSLLWLCLITIYYMASPR
jgi:uncharacterized membrane protein